MAPETHFGRLRHKSQIGGSRTSATGQLFFVGHPERDAMPSAEGDFEGRGGHILRGSFSLTTLSGGLLLETSSDFLFDGSAQPGWALCRKIPETSHDPDVVQAARDHAIGRLAPRTTFPYPEITGRHIRLQGKTPDLRRFAALFLWCYDRNVLLGVGPFRHPVE